MKIFHKIEILKGLLVSWVATVVDFGFVWIFHNQFYYIFVVLTWFLLWTIVNYFGYSYRVFDWAKNTKRKHFLSFIVISVIWIWIWLGMISWLVEFFAFNVLIAKSISLVVVFFINFRLRKLTLLKLD